MGEIRTFRCPACHYAATVSGANDAGMAVTTTTLACEECQELMDVVTGRKEHGFAPIAPRCERSKRHHVTLWRHPGPCPRCATEMRADEGGVTVLWD